MNEHMHTLMSINLIKSFNKLHFTVMYLFQQNVNRVNNQFI